VNTTTGDGRRGDAGPRRAGIRPGDRSCRRRESFEGQQAHGGDPCFATGGNVVNPRIGSGMQQGREVAEEETVEVVRNHEGGTLDGNWHSHLEGGAEPRSDAGAQRLRERGLHGRHDGGAIFGQPHERKPGFAAGSQGPERVGKVGAKVKRVARPCISRAGKRTGRRSSRARARRRARRSRRAAVNGQGAATSTGAPSPAGGTCRCGGVARTMPQRETRGVGRGGSLFRRQVPQPRGARRMRSERNVRP